LQRNFDIIPEAEREFIFLALKGSTLCGGGMSILIFSEQVFFAGFRTKYSSSSGVEMFVWSLNQEVIFAFIKSFVFVEKLKKYINSTIYFCQFEKK